ncbi:unnamed protein product [Schistocephalus solidus]|uniref:GCS light chain n=1 Tax=Schistocephalus solidus TaxID=70667 RepID=A0A183SMB2_SCHSO|nr:unnamed protein product [Schistocephalus solidus]
MLALDRLGLADIETLIVSVDPELSKAPITDVPPCMDFPSAKICKGTAESLLKVWPILEEFVKSNKVFRLGVCDMSADEMELLHSSVKIPPKVNQLFLGSSCLISDELQNFAKLHDVQLTTHQDSSEKKQEISAMCQNAELSGLSMLQGDSTATPVYSVNMGSTPLIVSAM